MINGFAFLHHGEWISREQQKRLLDDMAAAVNDESPTMLTLLVAISNYLEPVSVVFRQEGGTCAEVPLIISDGDCFHVVTPDKYAIPVWVAIDGDHRSKLFESAKAEINAALLHWKRRYERGDELLTVDDMPVAEDTGDAEEHNEPPSEAVVLIDDHYLGVSCVETEDGVKVSKRGESVSLTGKLAELFVVYFNANGGVASGEALDAVCSGKTSLRHKYTGDINKKLESLKIRCCGTACRIVA